MGYDDPEEDELARPDPIFSDHSRLLVFLIGLAGVLVLAGIFGYPRIRRELDTQKAHQLTQEAESLVEQGDLDLARTRLATALQLAGRDIDILRAAARLAVLSQSAEGLNYWQVLLGMPEATRADEVEYLSFALDLGRADLAREPLRKWLESDPTQADTLRLTARQLALSGQASEALATVRIWQQLHPDDPAAAEAAVELLSGQAEGDQGTHAWLVELARRDSPAQAAAIELLSRSTLLTPEDAASVEASIASRTNTPLPVRLAGLSLKVRLSPATAAAERGVLVASLASSAEVPDLERVGNWLVDHGGSEEAIRLIAFDRAKRSAALLTVRLRALAALDRWDEVRAHIESDTAHLVDAYLRHCFSAALDARQGRVQNLAGHLENAVRGCSNRAPALQFVAGYAESLGQNGPAITAHRKLMQFPRHTVASGRRILELAKPLDSIRIELDALRTLGNFSPEDEGVLQEHAYRSFVVNERAPALLESMRALAKKHPDNQAIRSILALGELRAGNSGAALTLLEAADMPWEQAQSRWLAIRVAVLGANQQREAARRFARRVDLKALKAEERLLVEPWLAPDR